MINLGKNLVWGVGLPIALTLATSGCASKKYVSQQIAPVNQRITKVEHATNEKIAFMNAKEERDVSQLNERISTTDARVAQVASAAEQAQGTASRAMQETQATSQKLSSAINTLGAGVANALNYQLVEKADVTFAFNKATLTPEAKMALDQIASKMQSMPRSVVELTGFTDRVGGANYNLVLSRRRAEAVQRYLVSQKVPPRCIHIVGMGKEAPPPDLEADLSAIDPNASKAQRERLARRVSIRVFGAGDITEGTASRIQQ
jgi:outer membrane protein OmpA-like peptidoglycan-associated protein